MKNVALKPPKPYIRQSDQTLSDPRKGRHGTPWPGERDLRWPAIQASSAALTRFISSGRFRSQGQTAAHHTNPKNATATKAASQPRQMKTSAPMMNGATAPPSRLHVQIRP